jgi:hypothetical protein
MLNLLKQYAGMGHLIRLAALKKFINSVWCNTGKKPVLVLVAVLCLFNLHRPGKTLLTRSESFVGAQVLVL